MLTWLLDIIRTLLFKPRVYKTKVIVLDPCWKHMKYKKGCPTCRSTNGS